MDAQSQSFADDIEVTRDLLIKYDRPGPRYTSYPTAPEWRTDFGEDAYREALARAAALDEPLSLYMHIPFCAERCAYCGCNVIITQHEDVVGKYVRYLVRELEMVARALIPRCNVAQLHWGGGTPTSLPPAEMRRVFEAIGAHFTFTPKAELAIEVDPRVTSEEQIATLRELGFNRISMGVQDLDPFVQDAIGRRQREEETRRLHGWCRAAGFEGINMDLIYGLPGQNVERWEQTIDKVIDIRPDRLAIYSYAHLPDKLHNQRKIDADLLPTGPDKFELFALARKKLLASGYRAIGMDHFALPHDELARAMDERRLHRNFMGYTVVPAGDQVGLSVSAIGEVGGCYAQNAKKLSHYYTALDEGRFAIEAGASLSEDDIVRRWTIRQLMCNFRVDDTTLQARFGKTLAGYFSEELNALAPLEAEGFLRREPDAVQVLPLGRVFVRNICMVFDAYLRRANSERRFSRTV